MFDPWLTTRDTKPTAKEKRWEKVRLEKTEEKAKQMNMETGLREAKSDRPRIGGTALIIRLRKGTKTESLVELRG